MQAVFACQACATLSEVEIEGVQFLKRGLAKTALYRPMQALQQVFADLMPCPLDITVWIDAFDALVPLRGDVPYF